MDKSLPALNAKEYDNRIKTILPFYEELLDSVIDVIKASVGAGDINWLDLGCGTGKLAEKALGDFDIKNMTLLDCDEHMLETAKSRLLEYNNKIICLNENIKNIQYESDYDVVTSVQALHYFNKEERKEAIEKCYNALKCNGIYINVENYMPFTEEGNMYGLKRWGEYQSKLGRTKEEISDHRLRQGTAYFPINIIEHLDLLKDAGFKHVEVFWVTYMQAGFFAIK